MLTGAQVSEEMHRHSSNSCWRRIRAGAAAGAAEGVVEATDRAEAGAERRVDISSCRWWRAVGVAVAMSVTKNETNFSSEHGTAQFLAE
jgi:hypothetical protein